MRNRRRSYPVKQHYAAHRIIRICLLIIGSSIIGGMAFEAILGVPASFIEALGIVILVVIGMWLKENT